MDLIILSISKGKQKINSKKVIYFNFTFLNSNYKNLRFFLLANEY